jgi:hypothetical protein
MKGLQMKKLIILLLSLCVLLVPRSSMMQETGTRKQQIATRSPVRLLPGYKLELAYGIEGGYGVRIWKDGGLSISGGIGCCFAAEANSAEKDELRWREEQEFNGRRATLAYTKDQELVITFADDKNSYPANFTAHVRDEYDVAAALLLVLTYEPTAGYPVEPGSIVIRPQDPRSFRRLSLLPVEEHGICHN